MFFINYQLAAFLFSSLSRFLISMEVKAGRSPRRHLMCEYQLNDVRLPSPLERYWGITEAWFI